MDVGGRYIQTYGSMKIRCLLIITGMTMCSLLASAQSALRLDLGAGPIFGWVYKVSNDFDPAHPYQYDLMKKGTGGNGSFSILAEIAVSKSRPFYIETGLGIGLTDSAFKNKYGEIEDEMSTFLRIPIKFDYRLYLGKKTSLTFGLGPYANWYITDFEYPSDSKFQIGLTPSVYFRYRKFSIGINYYNPVLYNGIQDINKNAISINTGLTFNLNPHWSGWKYIGAGVVAAGAIAGTVATLSDSHSNNYMVDDSFNNLDSGKTKHVSNSKNNDISKYTASDAYNASVNSRTYSNYVEQVSHMKVYGPVDMNHLKKLQKNMKKIREDNNKDSRNPKISKSDLEDWNGIRD